MSFEFFPTGLLTLLRPRLAVLALALCSASLCSAQNYPGRTITLVTPFSAGAGPDVLVRGIAQELNRLTGLPAIVENKPGAGAIVAAQAVQRATPDGYTVLVTGNVAFTGNPHVISKLPYDPVGDFTPITTLVRGPLYMYVNPQKLPAHNATELVGLLRKSPGKYSFGFNSITGQLPVEVLKQAAKLDLVGVRYRSGAAALPDLISGQIDLMVMDYSAWTYVKSGKLRAIGVTDTHRSPYAPDLPTFDESGIKGMDIGFWIAAYLPANAPPAVVTKLHQLLLAAVKGSEAKAAAQNMGVFEFVMPVGELAKYQAKEAAEWGRIIRAAGIKPE